MVCVSGPGGEGGEREDEDGEGLERGGRQGERERMRGRGGGGRLLLAFVHSCVRNTISGKGDYKGQPTKGDRVKNKVPSTS